MLLVRFLEADLVACDEGGLVRREVKIWNYSGILVLKMPIMGYKKRLRMVEQCLRSE
jgi:hypothetical protein